jgi:hypothetical protein
MANGHYGCARDLSAGADETMTMEIKQYYSSTVQDAEALCLELNAGHDATMPNAFFNGTVIIINRPGTTPLTVNPGNWIVKMPDGSLDVRADADFCQRFCAATSS